MYAAEVWGCLQIDKWTGGVPVLGPEQALALVEQRIVQKSKIRMQHQPVPLQHRPDGEFHKEWHPVIDAARSSNERGGPSVPAIRSEIRIKLSRPRHLAKAPRTNKRERGRLKPRLADWHILNNISKSIRQESRWRQQSTHARSRLVRNRQRNHEELGLQQQQQQATAGHTKRCLSTKHLKYRPVSVSPRPV